MGRVQKSMQKRERNLKDGRANCTRNSPHSRSPSETLCNSRSVGEKEMISPLRKLPEKKEREEKFRQGFIGRYHLGGVFSALMVAVLYFCFVAEDSLHGFPCHCCTSDGPLVSALSSKRFGLTGLHVQYVDRAIVEEQLAALPRCVKLYKLNAPFEGVLSFFQHLQNDALGNSCVVWLVEDAAVLHGVANSLKELLEDNSLRGERIMSRNSRALLVLLSRKSREELKDVFPHRVVHMLNTVRLLK